MINWTAEPWYRWWDAQLSLIKLSTADVLVLALCEYAHSPRPPVERHYKGLDRLKSLRGNGVVGVIVR